MRTLDLILEETGITHTQLAEKAGLPVERVEAIVAGRWTPSPADRKKLADSLGMQVEEISWGHTMPARNIRYHQFGMPKDEE